MTDATFTDHFFTTADGPRIHYRDYPAIGPERGLPVLCLHGLTRNVKDFEELAPRIAKEGRRVIVASQRGRGLSEPDPQPERYHPPVYSADMIGLLDALGIDRAVFVGTSMGGLMTFIIAGQQPERVAAAVINDIGPALDQAGLDRIKANVSERGAVKDWAEAEAATRASNLAAFPDRADDAEFWADFARKTWIENTDGTIRPGFDKAITRQVVDGPVPEFWDFWTPFADIPTLLVRGAITDLLTEETVAEMKRRKPDLERVDVAGVGHAPFMTEPEAWSAIRDFLGRVD